MKLYTGSQLADATRQLEVTPESFGDLERQFVDVGQKVERGRAERRQRLIMAGIGGLVVLFAILAGWGFRSSSLATSASIAAEADSRRARLAEAQALAAATRASQARSEAEGAAAAAAINLAQAQAALSLLYTSTPLPPGTARPGLLTPELRKTSTGVSTQEAVATLPATLLPDQSASATVVVAQTVEAIQTQLAQSLAIQQQVAGTGTPASSQLYAIIDGFDTRINSEPAVDAAPAALVHAPAKLPVISVNENFWVQVETSTGDLGWTDGRFITYEGDASLLPKALRHRVISNRADLPLVHGIVVSPDGSQQQYPLLDKPQENAAVLADIPVGTLVTVLLRSRGSSAYGSGRWYIVTLPDPSGPRIRWTGYLPVEVMAASP